MRSSMTLIALLLSLAGPASAGREGMPGMPVARPARVFTVPSIQAGEDLLEQRGFGDKEPEISMMNLMMVGGSGFEGMDMSEAGKKSEGHAVSPSHSHAPSQSAGPAADGDRYRLEARIASHPPKVGKNTLKLVVTDAKTGQPARGLRLQASVSMESMDMGISRPAVRETAPGTYSLRVPFSMSGPWSVRLRFPDGGERALSYEVE